MFLGTQLTAHHDATISQDGCNDINWVVRNVPGNITWLLWKYGDCCSIHKSISRLCTSNKTFCYMNYFRFQHSLVENFDTESVLSKIFRIRTLFSFILRLKNIFRLGVHLWAYLWKLKILKDLRLKILLQTAALVTMPETEQMVGKKLLSH